MLETPHPSAGWYPHPKMVDTMAYWDGERWTDHVAPGGARQPVSAPLMVSVGRQPKPAYRLGPKEWSISKKLLIAAVLSFVGLYICGLLVAELLDSLSLANLLGFVATLVGVALLIASLVARLVMGKPERG
jgi:Protein of unknown function (DUF2510)